MQDVQIQPFGLLLRSSPSQTPSRARARRRPNAECCKGASRSAPAQKQHRSAYTQQGELAWLRDRFEGEKCDRESGGDKRALRAGRGVVVNCAVEKARYEQM